MPPVSRTYWRSLGQLEDHPEYRAALEREFPEGASELDGITRRDMMSPNGVSDTGAVLSVWDAVYNYT